VLAVVLRQATRAALLLLLALVPSASVAQAQPSAARSTLYVAPAGIDTGSCRRAQPCASFDRAYSLARPGTVIEVAAGRYGAQTIRFRPSRQEPNVVIRPATAARVTVAGQLNIEATHLELRAMTLNDLELHRDAAHVTLRGITNHGFWISGASNITFVGGEVTCGRCPFHPFLVDGGAPDFRPPRAIVFDGVFFHDWQTAGDEHTECLQILAGDGITIRNSVFRECGTANGGRGSTANIHVSWIGRGPKTQDVLIENNFFYAAGNTFAINAGDWHNTDLRYNSIVGPILIGGGWGDGTPVELVGNVMRFNGCEATKNGQGTVSPLVFRYNVMDGGTCHSTDKNAPAGFVSPTRNLRLRLGAAAINAGDPRRYPRNDIDGERRPRGGRPDAGADERR
jgi:hypothetical protein